MRIITADTSCKGHSVNGFDNQPFTMSYVLQPPPPPPVSPSILWHSHHIPPRYNTAEPDGYNDLTVSDGGVIHLITSKNHYQFNLAWMLQRADPPPC